MQKSIFLKLSFNQKEVLINLLNIKYKSYFDDQETELDCFSWCFGFINNFHFFSEADFKTLTGKIRFNAKIIASRLLLDSK